LPLKTYLSQHHAITGMQQAQAAQQKRIENLQKSVDRYQDPAYIADQARQRLQLVQPGETDYIVVGGKKKAVVKPPVEEAPAVVVPGTNDDPWWTRMWASVGEAGAR
jgi:hypothetical protein